MSLKDSYFILCRPQLGENIGASARALKNFNIPNLRIVNPRCVWPNQKAKATSVGAKNILQSAKVYKSIEESIGATKKFKLISGYKSTVASKSEVNKFLHFIIKGLDKKGFLQPEHKRQSMVRNINNIFHRLNLSEQEIRILLGIFTTLNDLNNKS